MLIEIGNNKYKKIALFLGLLLVLLYIIENSFLLDKIGGTLFTYVMKPVLCSILVYLLGYKIPKVHLNGKILYQSAIYIGAFNCGMIYITINIVGGIMQGFGKSPYNHSLQGILTNLIAVGSTLLLREMIRSYMVSSYMRRGSKWAAAGIILFMTFTQIKLSQLAGIEDLKGLVIWGAEYFLPQLCSNIMATYLVLYGGRTASIIYLGIIELVIWLSPILPALNWLGKAVIGMMVPVFCLIYMMDSYAKMSKVTKAYRQKQESVWVWIPKTTAAVLFIWFVAGVFSIYPSVIATGSMEPMIKPGDVVLLEKIKDMEDIELLKAGDVIQFERGHILITHRIMEVVKEDNVLVYRTKGDNNSVWDSETVKPQDVKGILKNVVPKVGWPTLILKNSSSVNKNDIEF